MQSTSMIPFENNMAFSTSATRTKCLLTKRHSVRTGATMILVVILLPALFALSALAINLAYIESANTEIQVAADAAVRSAGRTYAQTGDENQALLAAQEAAARNPIGEFVLPITAMDLDFGTSVRNSPTDPYTFTPTGSGNAVRLVTRTLSSGNGPTLETIFPFFGSGFTIRTERTAVSTQGVIDIALIVDRSGSMAYAADEIAAYPPAPLAAQAGWDFGDPVPPNARWLDLIASVQVFINELENSPQEDFLSLSVYNTQSASPQKLTSQYSDIINKLGQISAQFDAGGTNIGQGIYEGLAAVTNENDSRPHASKVIILMTDGVHNYGTNPLSAANSVADAGVVLFTITFSDEADQATMQQVAEKCGGEHFHAVTAVQLQQAFQEIGRSLPTLLTK